MAKPAKPEADEAVEIQPPDFERAIRIMLNDVKPAEEKNASSRGDLSAAWKAIEEECHVNKKAAKLFAKLRAMSEETKDDFLRSLYGLMQAGGVALNRDLVDLAEGEEPPEMPVADKPERKLELVDNNG